jgi:uracil-DNA glycosylase family 4
MTHTTAKPSIPADRLGQFAKPQLRPALNYHCSHFANCSRCELGQTGVPKVFFRGHIPCEVLFVGEAPGDSESVVRRPFVGRAGKILDEIIDLSMNEWSEIATERVHNYTYAVTNTVLCQPPRDAAGKQTPPRAEHAEACKSRLAQFLYLAQPHIIITVGSVADKFCPRIDRMPTFPPEYALKYLGDDYPPWAVSEFDREAIATLAGRRHYDQSWPVTYASIKHPAWMLRQGKQGLELEKQRAKLVIQSVLPKLIPFRASTRLHGPLHHPVPRGRHMEK